MVWLHGERIDLGQPSWSFDTGEGLATLHPIPGLEDSGLGAAVVKNLLSEEDCNYLVGLCERRGGFVRSTQRSTEIAATVTAAAGGGVNFAGDVMVNAARTSSSCPLLWSTLYGSKRSQLEARGAVQALEELDAVEMLGDRIASFLNVTPAHLEPFQIVRYEQGQKYAPHHDYHTEPALTYAGEQRQRTLLLYLSTVPESDGGGATAFHVAPSTAMAKESGRGPDGEDSAVPALRVLPKAGDAILWSNVLRQDETLRPNPKSLHEGEAPVSTVKHALNCWVVDEPFDAAAAAGQRKPPTGTNPSSKFRPLLGAG